MKNKRHFSFYSLLLFTCVNVNAQAPVDINLSTNLPKMAPVSPEAASLGKFGQIPVSYYTGIPNISVPLYTIKTGDIQLPLSINYHAGGLKVEEMPSCLGLGWALSAGGVITRSQRGMDDESGYMVDGSSAKARNLYNGSLTGSSRDSFLLDIYRKYKDSEADVFYFNFGGMSGKFFYTDDGTFVTSPRSDLKVEFISNIWYITTGSGIRYKFSITEQTQSEPYCWTNLSGPTNNDASTSVSAWYLTEIKDKNDNVITLIYESESVNYRTKMTGTRNLITGGVQVLPDFSYCNNYVSVNGKRLKTIHFANGKVEFVRSGSTPPDGIYPLSTVTITDTFSSQVKKYQFYTSYFTTSGVGGCEDAITKRLRLDSLKEVSASSEYNPPYVFSYDTTNALPCRLSNAQDQWGYYNGKSNSTFVTYRKSLSGALLGADKSVDVTYAKAGSLKKIKYPAGGNSRFNYEGNSYSVYVPTGFDSTTKVFVTNLNGDNSAATEYFIDFNGSFTVSASDTNSSGNGSINSAFLYTVDNNSYFHNVYAVIYGPDSYVHVLNTSYPYANETLELPAGNYSLYVSIETEYAAIPYIHFNWDISKNPYKLAHYANMPYGGLRINSIINENTSGPNEELFFSYNCHDGNTPDSASTGEHGPQPDYSYELENHTSGLAPETSFYMVYNSSSNYPLQQTNGSPIGYRNVTVLYGPNGSNGKREFTYTTYSDHADILNLQLPYPSATEYDWRRGLLTKETTYRRTGADFIPVQKKEIDYVFNTADTTSKYVRSIKIGKKIKNGNANDFEDLQGLVYAGYLTVAEAFNTRRETITEYDQANGSLANITQTEYEYNNKNFQEKRRAVNSSRGDSIIFKTRYAVDFGTTTSTGTAAFLHDMAAKNIISAPVEQLVSRKNGSGEKMVSGKLTVYKPSVSGVDKEYSLVLNSPVNTGSFTTTSVDGSNDLNFSPAYEQAIIYNKYYSNGRPAQLRKESDRTLSFIFGHVGELVLAEAINADSASVAFTSFEEDSKGNWTYDVAGLSTSEYLTGKKDYQVSYGISKSGLNSSDVYILSYWSRNGSYTISGGTLVATGSTINGWTYYEHEVTGVTSTGISGTGKMDELRLYPKGALMTSYTYEPLRGMTSTCDTKNQITYYEYDDFGRFTIVRDQYRNIVKQICYSYSGQPTDCTN